MDFLIVRAMPDNRQGRKSPADARNARKGGPPTLPGRRAAADHRQEAGLTDDRPTCEVAAVALLTRHRAARPRSRADRFLT